MEQGGAVGVAAFVEVGQSCAEFVMGLAEWPPGGAVDEEVVEEFGELHDGFDSTGQAQFGECVPEVMWAVGEAIRRFDGRVEPD